MRGAIFHAVLMAAPISLTYITWSAAAAARTSRRDRHMFLPPDGSSGADSMGLELLAFFNSVGETLTKNIWISLALAAVFTVLTWFWATCRADSVVLRFCSAIRAPAFVLTLIVMD